MFRGFRGGSGGGGGGGISTTNFVVSLVDDTMSPYSLTASTTRPDYISVNTTNGPVTINISSPTGVAGKMIVVKDALGQSATNNITVSCTGNIDNSSSVVLSNNGSSLLLISDGVRWGIN